MSGLLCQQHIHHPVCFDAPLVGRDTHEPHHFYLQAYASAADPSRNGEKRIDCHGIITLIQLCRLLTGREDWFLTISLAQDLKLPLIAKSFAHLAHFATSIIPSRSSATGRWLIGERKLPLVGWVLARTTARRLGAGQDVNSAATAQRLGAGQDVNSAAVGLLKHYHSEAGCWAGC